MFLKDKINVDGTCLGQQDEENNRCVVCLPKDIEAHSTKVNFKSHSTNYIFPPNALLIGIFYYIFSQTHSSALFSEQSARFPVPKTLMQFLIYVGLTGKLLHVG